jgi:hypothetical protein
MRARGAPFCRLRRAAGCFFVPEPCLQCNHKCYNVKLPLHWSWDC